MAATRSTPNGSADIPGVVPAPGNRPTGCRFRAALAPGRRLPICRMERPGAHTGRKRQRISMSPSGRSRRVTTSQPNALQLVDLVMHHKTPRGVLHALTASICMSRLAKRSETVGESGCGKSTLARCVVRLDQPQQGSILLGGQEVSSRSSARKQRARLVQMVFQDPMSSLNPRLTVLQIIQQPLVVHGVGTRAERQSRVVELIEQVGLGARHLDEFPHELSGGQRQRVSIARALAPSAGTHHLRRGCVSPRCLRTGASTQPADRSAREFQRRAAFHFARFLPVASATCRTSESRSCIRQDRRDRRFRIRLETPPSSLYARAHRFDSGRGRPAEERQLLTGHVPSPIDPPPGCAFASRCPRTPSRYAVRPSRN